MNENLFSKINIRKEYINLYKERDELIQAIKMYEKGNLGKKDVDVDYDSIFTIN